MEALRAPVVGAGAPALPALRLKEEELVRFVSAQCCMPPDRIREYAHDFGKRLQTFRQGPRPLLRYKVNELRQAPSFADPLAMLQGKNADGDAQFLESDSDSIASS
jgi:hypothetical protein